MTVLARGGRTVIATLATPTVAEAAARAEEARRPELLFELRLDRLTDEEVASGAWLALPGRIGGDWLLTWRSRAEGGRDGRPEGVLEKALDGGYRWVDVEAAELDRAGSEADEVPAERRWVSAHREMPDDEAELEALWSPVARREAAVRKLVVTARSHDDVAPVLRLATRAAEGSGATTVFAQGAAGFATRVLGGLRDNAVTFARPGAGRGAAPGQPEVGELLEVYGFADLAAEPAVYGVLGEAALLSLSPRLHNPAFRDAGLAAVYLPFEAEAPAPVLAALRRGEIAGLSVTQPFKGDALAVADRPSPEAVEVGAVNTLWTSGGGIHADNTDRLAARALLAELGLPAGGRVAVIGAGGAALAVLAAVRDLGGIPEVFARREEPGRAAAERFGGSYGGTPEAFDPAGFAVVANATPLGRGSALPTPWGARDWSGVGLLDLAYDERPTGWALLASERGLPLRDGRVFLARQAVEQFARWTGIRPDAEAFLRRIA